MTQVPDLTIEDILEVNQNHELASWVAQVANKALAWRAAKLAEQATQDQFISTDEARAIVESGGRAEWQGRATMAAAYNAVIKHKGDTK